jgi:hypothetical protein
MSVVGPRPHAVAHNETYRKLIKGYMIRHKVKPGITGWAQVNGARGETDTVDKMQQRIEFDLEYLRHWSLRWDLAIVLRTVLQPSAATRTPTEPASPPVSRPGRLQQPADVLAGSRRPRHRRGTAHQVAQRIDHVQLSSRADRVDRQQRGLARQVRRAGPRVPS